VAQFWLVATTAAMLISRGMANPKQAPQRTTSTRMDVPDQVNINETRPSNFILTLKPKAKVDLVSR
jgi:hypothetical protein